MSSKPDTCHSLGWKEKHFSILLCIAKILEVLYSKIAPNQQVPNLFLLLDYRFYYIILSLLKPSKKLLLSTSSKAIMSYLSWVYKNKDKINISLKKSFENTKREKKQNVVYIDVRWEKM